jgi:hypothetical protein
VKAPPSIARVQPALIVPFDNGLLDVARGNSQDFRLGEGVLGPGNAVRVHCHGH